MGLGFSHLPFTHKASILNVFLLNPLKTRLTCLPESSVVPCLCTKALYWPNKLTHNAVSSERRERERESILAWLFWHHIGFPHSRDPGLHKIKVRIPLCRLVKDTVQQVYEIWTWRWQNSCSVSCCCQLHFHTVWQLNLPYQKNVFKWFNVINQHLYMYI